MAVLSWLIALAAALVVVRALLLRRAAPPAEGEAFDGVVHRVGRARVAERGGPEPRATVICVHGFCEDPRYFTRFYADPALQLILIASADYRATLAAPESAPPWAMAPAHVPGSIEYDAEILGQALAYLPRSASVRVHGHSRGAAVALEAAAARPALFRDVEVILEAPVLPRARPRRPFSRVVRWVFPFVHALWRLAPISAVNRRLWGPLENARKRALIRAYPFNGSAGTYVRNLASLDAWMNGRDFGIYRHLHGGTVLVPGDDQVLDPDAMEVSAREARRLDVVRLEGCSHFVLFDRPDAIPPVRSAAAAPSALGP